MEKLRLRLTCPTPKETQTDVVEQITVKTKSGTKTRLDVVGKDKSTGQIKLTEAKSSSLLAEALEARKKSLFLPNG